MGDALELGERVLVSIGAEDVEAEVVEVYGPLSHRRVRVRIDIVGCDGERLDDYEVSKPVTRVRPIAAA